MILRPIAAADHSDVLALNERNVELLAPMDGARLSYLAETAETAAVIEVDGAFAGFVLTFVAGAAYDGANFGWFSRRFDNFCYLDRVVIHEDFRRRGLASRVYDELESSCGRPLFALEVNLDPPNEPSLAFHQSRRFVEVGQRVFEDHLLSMFLKTLPS